MSDCCQLARATRVCYSIGMLHPNHDSTHTVRTVFVIDPAKKVRLTIAYPQSCGRNFDELLRTIDSLQLTDAHGVATPAHWRVGDDVIILPAISDEEAQTRSRMVGTRSNPIYASPRIRACEQPARADEDPAGRSGYRTACTARLHAGPIRLSLRNRKLGCLQVCRQISSAEIRRTNASRGCKISGEAYPSSSAPMNVPRIEPVEIQSRNPFC